MQEHGHPEGFEKTWDFCINNSVIAIGWHQVGDLTGLTRAEIKRVYEQVFPGERTKGYLNLQRFWLDIHPGDRVVARCGTKVAVGFGTVLDEPYYNKQQGEDWASGLPINPHPSFLSIRWDSLDEYRFPFALFPRFTVGELRESHKHWHQIKVVTDRVWPEA